MRREFLVQAMAALLLPRAARATGCTPTSAASQGPYWRPGAPSTRDLRRYPTDRELVVRGRLVDARTCAPIAGRLEVWQADGTGRYDVDLGGGVTFGRASLRTAADGSYEFVTTRPAPYGSGAWRRPAHIHFIVSADGKKDLVTQLYFAGDPNLGSDPLRDVHPDLVVRPEASGGRETAAFEIRLG